MVQVAAALLTLGACASGGASGKTRTSRHSRNVITSEELATATDVTNAYDAVLHLRPQFLQSRGNTSMNEESSPGGQPLPIVFLDGQRFGGVETLRNIPLSNVKEIHFISAADATTRWGTGYANGVIEVISGGR
jgi:hypothetical protein